MPHLQIVISLPGHSIDIENMTKGYFDSVGLLVEEKR